MRAQELVNEITLESLTLYICASDWVLLLPFLRVSLLEEIIIPSEDT